MWTVCVYGEGATNLIRYRFTDEPEHREVEDLMLKHGAPRADVQPPTTTEKESR